MWLDELIDTLFDNRSKEIRGQVGKALSWLLAVYEEYRDWVQLIVFMQVVMTVVQPLSPSGWLSLVELGLPYLALEYLLNMRKGGQPAGSAPQSLFSAPFLGTPPQELPLLPGGPAIAGSVSGVSIFLENASLEIHHSQAAEEITWSANYPEHFKVDADGIIRQVQFQEGSLFVNGRVVSVIKGVISAVGNLLDLGNLRRLENIVVTVPASFTGALNVQYNRASEVNIDCWGAGEVTLNGEAVNDLVVGGNLSGLRLINFKTADAGSATFHDIEALSCRLETAGSGDLQIGGLAITDGSCELVGSDDGDLTVDGFTKVSGRLDCDISGRSALTLGDVAAGSCRIASESAYNVQVASIEADTCKLSGSDEGDVSVEGKIKIAGEFDCEMSGFSALTLGGVEAGSCRIASESAYNVQVASIEADTCKLSGSESGDVVVNGRVHTTGEFCCDMAGESALSLHQVDAGSFQLDQCSTETAEIEGDISVTGKCGCRVTWVGDVSMHNIKAGGDVALTSKDAGSIYAGDITSTEGEVSVILTDEGSADLEYVCAPRVTIKVSGLGNFECRSVVSSDLVIVEHDGDGEVTIDRLKACKVKVRSTGEGTVTIRGSAASVEAIEEGFGKITLNGQFDVVTGNLFDNEEED